MKFISKLLLAAVLSAASANMVFAEDLVIMHTNDVHGCMEPDRPSTAGGWLRCQVLVDSIRKAEPLSLLVDAGDDVQGYMYFTLYGGEVEYGFMNRMDYDITIPGNHEFDNGLEALARNYATLRAERLCANYDFTGTPMEGLTKDYTIRTFGDRKIAFIGVGCQPKGMIIPENIRGVTYSDPARVADSIAGRLKAEGRADYAILLSHIGYTTAVTGLPCDSLLAASTRHIDLIIGGHSHTVIDPAAPQCPNYLVTNKAGRTVLIAQTGRWGTRLGKITIDLDSLTKVPRYELLPVDSRYDSRISPETRKWLEPYRKGVEERMNQVIGHCDTDMTNDSLGALSNWVADMTWKIGSRLTGKPVDMAIVNIGGIRRPMPAGDISLGLIETMLPFSNSILVIRIDGRSLLDCFDIMARRNGDAISRQASAGMKDGRAIDILINGRPVDPERIYTIATIDYLAGGGDYMEPLTHGRVIARSENLFKTDIARLISEMTRQGKTIKPDNSIRMYNITTK